MKWLSSKINFFSLSSILLTKFFFHFKALHLISIKLQNYVQHFVVYILLLVFCLNFKIKPQTIEIKHTSRYIRQKILKKIYARLILRYKSLLVTSFSTFYIFFYGGGGGDGSYCFCLRKIEHWKHWAILYIFSNDILCNTTYNDLWRKRPLNTYKIHVNMMK